MPKAQLLLVEDDSALAELVRWHFEREEFDVQHTGDGEEALLMAKERTPDLVLLDWMLENLSGIEVCRQLRKADNTANVPIIMLTARGEEDDRIRGLEIGADDYVTKPFSPRELVARAKAGGRGGSLIATIDLLKRAGCKEIRALVLVAAPVGIDAVLSKHPDVHIYTASIDDGLNEHGYIMPGLGDAGDRIFGTK